MSDSAKAFSIEYKFVFSSGKIQGFEIWLSDETLGMIHEKRRSYPEWTRLSFSKCPNCPLKETDQLFCPIAANLVDVFEFFKDSVSHEEVDVEINMETRSFRRRTALQNGMSSLVGICMVTSGCPVMDKLRPMVQMHLPFATGKETLYRVITMYLLAQYFRYKKGELPDWDMKGLVRIYEDIRIVNRAFCQRLRAFCGQDANFNAIIHLDCFADLATYSLGEEHLQDLSRLFSAYF